MGISLRAVKLVVSLILGAAGVIIIVGAFTTPYAFTTLNGFFQLVLGAVLIWFAITVALAKKQDPSDAAVLVDERPPTEEELARREAINMTYALGSDALPRGNAPLGYSVHDPPRRSTKDEERK
jgi:hypothetical protein